MQDKSSSLQQVLSRLIGSGDNTISAAFPNLSKLAAVLEVLPVTTATVECTFISMKLIKIIRPHSKMGEDTLEHTMHNCIEDCDPLYSDTLEAVVHHYKGAKKCKLVL